ncbi:hypothetical protein PACTADRAFT_76817 [Pachysolen tannophilus NRRL Y-2460]|uniref:Magnesium transport protein CorA n=1 Tax=Pachysolen tannophilus NRRL Y-2460 TaxID=669874 RepID=A0A1E4TR12_PACTA|nr:hypothetical protein PACTADRAFT_76817 [Pachysolen tannophilus NRRL Y-2460]
MIYDSGDPNYPNLPALDDLETSSLDEYNFSQSESEGSSLELIDKTPSLDETCSNRKKKQNKDRSRSVSSEFQMFDGEADDGAIRRNSGIRKKNHANKKRQKTRKYYDSKISASAARKRANWEPGVDVPSTKVVLDSLGSAITITDYSESRYRVEHLEVPTERQDFDLDDSSISSDEYIQKINRSVAALDRTLKKRPGWSKVRWINVNGLSWETISVISQHYQLHKLAIEDMIDIPQRTKVDQYPNHNFLCLQLIKLIKVNKKIELDKIKKNQKRANWFKYINRAEYSEAHENDISSNVSSRKYTNADSGVGTGIGSSDHTDDEGNLTKKDSIGVSSENGSAETSTKNAINLLKNNESLSAEIANSDMRRPADLISANTSRRKLKALEVHRPLSYRNLDVGTEQVSIFMTHNGTVISFFEHSASEIENAILSRLSSERTILRDSCDSSILLQAILDSTVDLAFPVVTAYRRRLTEMEIDILTDPTISHIQELHLMLNELGLLKRTIVPITSLVNSLRDHSKKSHEEISKSHETASSTSSSSTKRASHINSATFNKHMTLPSFISQDCDIYLADVADHTVSYTDDITTMENIVSNLIDMIFNLVSIDSNNSMNRLSLITVIFLPLSFWTGYFGMNFTKFGNLDENVSFYWKVAVPFSAVLLILLMVKTIQKTSIRWYKLAKRIYREIKIDRDLEKERKLREHKKKLRLNHGKENNEVKEEGTRADSIV